jgi:hypothetical protein
MDENEISLLIQSILLERNTAFLKEQDIQIYLAMKLIESEIFDKVFVEYRVPINLINDYPWGNTNKIDIDILLEKEGRFMPVEIKYKTKSTIIERRLLGTNTRIELANHVAHTNSCYDIWKDVKRNELLASTFDSVNNGVVIFITNDEKYIHGPNNRSSYYNFSFRNTSEINEVRWGPNVNASKLISHPNYVLDITYNINWVNMNINECEFKLLIL